MSGTPLTITLYASGDEGQTYTRSIIPWGILKKAIALTKSVDQKNIGEKDMDAMAGLIVEAFGNQFSVNDLDNGADVGEMFTVLQNIVARAGALVRANPTIASSSKRKKR